MVTYGNMGGKGLLIPSSKFFSGTDAQTHRMDAQTHARTHACMHAARLHVRVARTYVRV